MKSIACGLLVVTFSICCSVGVGQNGTARLITPVEIEYYTALINGQTPSQEIVAGAYVATARRLMTATKRHGIAVSEAEAWYCAALLMGLEPNRGVVAKVRAIQRARQQLAARQTPRTPDPMAGWFAEEKQRVDAEMAIRCPYCGSGSCSPSNTIGDPNLSHGTMYKCPHGHRFPVRER